MLFCSANYLVFMLAVFTIYWALPWARARVFLLLAAGLFFYGSWSLELMGLVVVTSLLDYGLARVLDITQSPLRRKLLLGVSLTVNLGVLVYFKYANFFLAELGQVLQRAGASTSFPVLKILAPIGISFYTFEAISYVVDVYRRKIPAEKNPLHFLLFITFFPHLVAGPIVRGGDFLPQIKRPKFWNWARIQWGVQLLVLGIFKKIAIADRMALFSEPVFAHPGNYDFATQWIALIAFAFQIYCDFSGYSDMAIGSAHLLGYKLTPNFNMPFLAVNVSDLWRRWHISLSTWMRDYLYIPLGGSRCSAWRTAFNSILVMSLGGLWHGAGWGFLLWGFLHGVFLVIHRAFAAWCRPRPWLSRLLETWPGTSLRVALTFLCFLIPLIFFRTASVGDAWTMLQGMLRPHAGSGSPFHRSSMISLCLLVAIVSLLNTRSVWRSLERAMPAPLIGVSYGGMLLTALVLSPHLSQAFFYFQF